MARGAAGGAGATLLQRGLADLGLTDLETLQERAATALAQVGQALYVLFFLFRDGPRIGHNIRLSLPSDLR